jgi:hypothetical protein
MKRKKKPKTATIRKCFFSSTCLAAFLACFSLLTISAPCERRQPPKAKDYALIFGTVWGPDDRPLVGITVKIRRAGEKKVRWEVHSNRRGEFEQEVPSGKQDYVVWADVKGYKLQNGKRLQASHLQ